MGNRKTAYNKLYGQMVPSVYFSKKTTAFADKKKFKNYWVIFFSKKAP